IAWNILGLADFAVAVTLGAITSPGPTQLIVPDVPSIGAGAYPGILTPAFVVPSSILLHVLSLRQLRRRSRAEAARR
ncbi:MAG: MFS transporter, partial [Bradyrhizobium sp.]|nr:MFS transporter [Bradyrhizobium sp.]